MTYDLRSLPSALNHRGVRLILAALLALLLVGAGAYAWFARGLPTGAALIDYQLPLPTTVRDRNGAPMKAYIRERRVELVYGEIPKLMVGAVLSAEDRKFFSHGGVDYLGIVRAVWTNMTTSGRPQGASTITQQLAKNLLVGNEVSYARKIREAILAYRIEAALPKERILTLYLNQIPLGRNSFGVQAAARAYFDRDIEDLTPAQYAFLASLPKAPEVYGRAAHEQKALARRNWILGEMAQNGYLSLAAARAAQATPLGLLPRPPAMVGNAPPEAGYFIEEVRRLLLARFGTDAKDGPNSVYGGGLWVRTSYDPVLQAAATTALREGLVRLGGSGGWRGPIARVEPGEGWAGRFAAANLSITYRNWRTALVLDKDRGEARIGLGGGVIGLLAARDAGMPGRDGHPAFASIRPGDVILVAPLGNPAAGQWGLRSIPAISGGMVVESPHTGQIFAMQGGFDAGLQAFNRATQALRQPGSSFKPFVYSAALDAGMTPASQIMDGPFCVSQGARLGTKCFRNFGGGGGSGLHTMRWGLEQSRNLMTVRAASQTGMKPVVALADRLGISAPGQPYPAVLSVALGAGDTTVLRLVNAFAILANQGRALTPTLIDAVQDRTGKVIWRADARACPRCNVRDYDGGPMPRPVPRAVQAMDPVTAYQMVHMLEGVIQRGTATTLRSLNRPIFGKTGTSSGPTNAWFVGGSADLIAGVYVGYDQPRPMGSYVQGGTVAAPIFGAFARQAMEGMPVKPFRAPAGVKLVRIDRRSGQRVYGDWPLGDSDGTIWEAFRPASEPRRMLRPAPPLRPGHHPTPTRASKVEARTPPASPQSTPPTPVGSPAVRAQSASPAG